MKRLVILLVVASKFALISSTAFAAANGNSNPNSNNSNSSSTGSSASSSTTGSSSSSQGTGVQGGSTGGAANVANTNSNVGSGNEGNGIGNAGSSNTGNDTSTGSAGGTHGGSSVSSTTGSTTGELLPVDTTGGNPPGPGNDGAESVANAHSNTGEGNEGNGIGNTGTGNQGNDTSTGSAGGSHDTDSTTTTNTTGAEETNGEEVTGTTGEEVTGTTGEESTGEESTGEEQSSNGEESNGTEGGSNGERRDLDFRIDFIPLIYADFVKTRRVINLTTASNFPSAAANLIDKSLQSYQGSGCETQQEIPMQQQCTHFDFFRPIALEVDQFRDGFKVVDYYDFVIGAGGAANLSLVNGPRVASLFNATVGLLPMGGKSLRIERFVKSQKETQVSERELRRAKFPYKVETLFANFNPGDSAEVTSQGGVLAFASAGFAGFQLGVNYLFNGTWKTSVQLGENKMVSVKVNKIKMHTIAGSAGVGVMTVAIDHFRNMDDSFSFMLDLSKKANVEIYQDLVRGHLIPAQKAAKSAFSGVQVVSSYKARTLGRKKVAYVGLPIFINKTWQSGVAETSVEALERDGKNYLVHVGSYFNNSSYRRINKTDDKVSTFVGQLVQPKDGGALTLSAQFAWGFSTTDLWMPRMNHELNKFYRYSGLKNNFGIVIPNVRNLGNLTTSVEIVIPHAGIMNLLSLPKGSLSSYGSDVLKSYFVAGDADKLCVAHPTTRVCRAVWKKKTVKSLEKAEEILADMRTERNADKFAKSFALLGQEMLDNQFAFQAILKSTCTPAEFGVVVEGERVSRVVKKNLIANPCY